MAATTQMTEGIRSQASPGAGPAVARRGLLVSLAVALALPSAKADNLHGRVGPVRPPVTVPDLDVVSSDGQRRQLRDMLAGRVSAVQLMFSHCRSICPIEAATFARVQEALAGDLTGRIQLVSLSIDPASDTPEVLKAWLQRFGAHQGWDAVAPAIKDLALVRRFFDQGSGFGEDHSTAMYVFDSDARLVWRSSELPAPDDVARLLIGLNRRLAGAPSSRL